MIAQFETEAGEANADAYLDDIQPNSLSELLSIDATQLKRVDIARMNLLCGESLPGAERVGVNSAMSLLDRWAEDAAQAVSAWDSTIFKPNRKLFENSHALYTMYAISTCLQQLHGIQYSPNEMDADKPPKWHRADLYMLFGMLHPERHFEINRERYANKPKRHQERPREGTCATLPVLLTAVARRLRLPVFLTHSYGHLFCTWDGNHPRFRKHASPDQRVRHNIEFSNDFDHFPDEWYHQSPKPWPRQLHEDEAKRKVKCYLRPLEPAEELAVFLVTRSGVLESLHRYREAHEALEAASELAPAFDYYPEMAVRCHQKWLEHVLKPWAISIAELRKLLLRRYQGGLVRLPWEVSPGVCSEYHPYQKRDDATALTYFESGLKRQLRLVSQKMPLSSVTMRFALNKYLSKGGK